MTRDSLAPMPVADWNLMLEAVTYRLRHDVHGLCAPSAAAQRALLDCAQALDLLRAMLSQEGRVGSAPVLCGLPNRPQACDAAKLAIGDPGGSGGTLERRLA